MCVTQQTQSWEGECSAVVESSLGHQAAIRAAASSSRQRTVQNIERLKSPLCTEPRNCDRTREEYSLKRVSSTCERENAVMGQRALSGETGDRVCTCCVPSHLQTDSATDHHYRCSGYIVHRSQATYSRRYVATGT